eukprot:SAG31_NODE_29197_length_399_cov_0.866667_2_plen_47_part_01
MKQARWWRGARRAIFNIFEVADSLIKRIASAIFAYFVTKVTTLNCTN